jgi:hypothetical protein
MALKTGQSVTEEEEEEEKILICVIELRPLRERCQELTAEYEQKKHVYDTTTAGLESATAKLEQVCFIHNYGQYSLHI